MMDGAEEEGEMMFVNTVQQGESDWREPDNSWLELNGGEGEEIGGVYCIGACLRERGPMPGTEEETPQRDVVPLRRGRGCRGRMVVLGPTGTAARRGG